MMTHLLSISLLMVMPASGNEQEVDTSIDQPGIRGDWKVLSMHEEGRIWREVVREVGITDNALEMGTGGGRVTYKLTWAGQGKLDVRHVAGAKYLAIYKRSGDRLRVCWNWSGRERPDEFSAKVGSNRLLFILERKKPE